MSYILDALRRAESERQRGQLPGLGAVPTPAAGLAAGDKLRPMGWGWVLMLVLLMGAAALGWWWRASASREPAAPVAAVPAAAQVAPADQAVAAPPPPADLAPAPALPTVVSAPPVASPVRPSASAAEASAPRPAAADPAPVKLADLSPQQRAQWPALALGGSVWSDSAASRFVILNGQVLREGETVAPGLVLERIQATSAVLRWRGLRVELPL